VTRWGMVVDINRCVGCQTCTAACKHTNDTPPGVQWRRVLDVEYGAFPDVERLFLVVGCQHCANPPCVPVCPTGATRQRADGLVTMNYDTCIGCGSCAVACPYQARTIVHDQEWYFGRSTPQEAYVARDDRLGVANKCTFCIERIDQASAKNLVPGVDLQVTPACAASCIAKAIRFGDFSDPESEVSQLARDNRSFQMHAELGTDPQIRYLYEVPASTPGRAFDASDTDEAALADPSNPLVGTRQAFWDYRAAMSFMLGGMASGLATIAGLAHFGDGLSGDALHLLDVVAAALMAVGLFFVFLKLGRKARFLNVLRRPQTSWMTRETYCVALFYPTVAAALVWPHAALDVLATACAGCFLLCQASILHAGKGIPTWRAPLMRWMLIATGLLEGAGAVAVVAPLSSGRVTFAPVLLIGGIALVFGNAALWWRYRATAKAHGIGPLSRRDLATISPALNLLGYAMPGVLFALSLVAGNAEAAIFAACGGAAAIAGGMLWKFTVIVKACHQQGYAVPMLPRRGSGRRAAPIRLGLG
jgi:Fe-S-cluster-containing dehydrogenase component/DMSO reductase anchor subunit